MKGNYSVGSLISQIILAFVVLLCCFYYFDPTNELHRETDTTNMLLFGVLLPAVFTIISIIICLLLGLPIRLVPRVRNWWLSRPFISLTGLAIGIALLFISEIPGLKITRLTNYNGELVEEQLSNLNISLTGWFITAFMLVHSYTGDLAAWVSRRILGKNDWSNTQ